MATMFLNEESWWSDELLEDKARTMTRIERLLDELIENQQGVQASKLVKIFLMLSEDVGRKIAYASRVLDIPSLPLAFHGSIYLVLARNVYPNLELRSHCLQSAEKAFTESNH